MKREDSSNTYSRYFRLSSHVEHNYCCGIQDTCEHLEYGHNTLRGDKESC